MPEQVDGFPQSHRPSTLFDPLVDGKVWKITTAEWGERCASANSASASARYYAKSSGIKSKVVIKGSDLYVRFGEPEPDQDDVAARRQARRQARLAGQAQ